jgi:hypothetical protein
VSAALTFTVPVATPSLANQREHWAKRARRAKAHRSFAASHGRIASGLVAGVDRLPCVVLLVRVSARPLDDDNLRGALKSIRDGVSDWLGVDDRDPRVTWDYAQEQGPQKTAHIRVEVRSK